MLVAILEDKNTSSYHILGSLYRNDIDKLIDKINDLYKLSLHEDLTYNGDDDYYVYHNLKGEKQIDLVITNVRQWHFN